MNSRIVIATARCGQLEHDAAALPTPTRATFR
jgi:hypothetical protein